MVREVTGYEGFLSSARFIDDDNIITGSGEGDSVLCTIGKPVKLRPSDMLVVTQTNPWSLVGFSQGI